MHGPLAFAAAIAFATAACAQTPSDLSLSSLTLEPAHVWEIPALGYGKNVWSILRLSNNSDFPASVHADVYCGAGDPYPLDPTLTVEAHKTSDVRIEGTKGESAFCWARIKQLTGTRGSGMELRAFVELLKGNQLEDFDREPRPASGNSAWAIPEGEIGGQQLYVLNASEKPTVLTFCVGNKPSAKECDRKGANPVQKLAKPHQAVLVEVKKFKKKYLITESSTPGRAILEVFNDEPGHRRVYSSESSISFDDSGDK